MGRRYFGTDGIRGRVGDSPIVPQFVMRLGYAAGRVLTMESMPTWSDSTSASDWSCVM